MRTLQIILVIILLVILVNLYHLIKPKYDYSCCDLVKVGGKIKCVEYPCKDFDKKESISGKQFYCNYCLAEMELPNRNDIWPFMVKNHEEALKSLDYCPQFIGCTIPR